MHMPTDIQALLAQGMGPTLHWFPADVTSERLAMVLVGMANAQGGTVLLGVAPRSAQIQGITDGEAAQDLVFQAALLVDPPLVLPVPRLVPIRSQDGRSEAETRLRGGPQRDTQIVWITVPAGLPNVYSLGGRYLGRDGTQTNPLPARRLRQLLMERGVIQFEAQVPPGATLEDLDWDKVGTYIQALDLPGGETALPEAAATTLLHRGCLHAVRGDARPPAVETQNLAPLPPHSADIASLRPTYAALLLFGRHPQQWVPNTSILAARFSGRTLADRFVKQEIGGTLPEQLIQAEAFIRDNIRSVVRLVGLVHQETAEYPLEALREVLVNAVAHRDYNVQGDNIHIYVFSDRIEIHSPGGLPGPMTLDNLLEARFSRNPVLVQVLADLGFVERLGYGLNRVMEVMRQNNLRLPHFEETAGTFRVTLFGAMEDRAFEAALPDLRPYQELELNPRQQQALVFLLRNRRITNRDYQELCPDVHAETLRRDLADLVERGVVIKVGDKRATYYILKKG
jgi:ATP-dependent DNA helicase RecG